MAVLAAGVRLERLFDRVLLEQVHVAVELDGAREVVLAEEQATLREVGIPAEFEAGEDVRPEAVVERGSQAEEFFVVRTGNRAGAVGWGRNSVRWGG